MSERKHQHSAHAFLHEESSEDLDSASVASQLNDSEQTGSSAYTLGYRTKSLLRCPFLAFLRGHD